MKRLRKVNLNSMKKELKTIDSMQLNAIKGGGYFGGCVFDSMAFVVTNHFGGTGNASDYHAVMYIGEINGYGNGHTVFDPQSDMYHVIKEENIQSLVASKKGKIVNSLC